MIAESDQKTAQQGMTGKEWLLLLVLATIYFTHLVDFIIMMPLGTQIVESLRISYGKFGILVAAYGFSAAITGLIAAQFLDRFDRKNSMILLYFCFITSTLLCALGQNYWFLLVARILAGGFGGLVGANVVTIVGDAFDYSRRGTAMGIVMSGYSLSLIAGVPLGLVLAGWYGWRFPFYALGALSLIVLFGAYWILPPLRGHLDSHASHEPRASLWDVLVNPNHVRAYALMTALVFGVFMIVPYIATYMELNVKLSKEQIRYIYLVGGLGTLVTVHLFGRLSDRFGKLRVFRIMALLTIVPIVLLTNLPEVPVYQAIAVTTLFMVTTSARWIPAQAMITASSSPRQRGSFMSVASSVQQAANGIASIVGGYLVDAPTELENLAGNHPLKPIVGYAYVGLISAGFTVLSVILAGRLRMDTEGMGAVDEVADVDEPVPLFAE